MMSTSFHKPPATGPARAWQWRSRMPTHRLLLLALLAAAGCTPRQSLLTTTPSLPRPASAGGVGDVQAHTRVTSFVEPLQPADPSTDVILITPRVAVGATGTIRFGEVFALRPIIETGLAQSAISGMSGNEDNYGEMPSLMGGPGFMFRIGALEERVTFDIEIDPLLGWSVLRTEHCTVDFSTCSTADEDMRFAFLPRGSLVIAYQMAPWARAWIAGGAAAQPVLNDSLAAVGIVGTGLELTPHPLFSIVMDVEWPFAGSPLAYGPTFAVGGRFNFGQTEPAAPLESSEHVVE